MSDDILDTSATSASLTMNTSRVGIIDAIPESGSFDLSLDHDWYAVSLTGGHTYQFLGTGGSFTAIDIAIDLKDASRHILDIQGVVNSDANGNASFYYTAPTTGTY